MPVLVSSVVHLEYRRVRHPQRFHQQSSLPETPPEGNSRPVKVESLPQAKQQPASAAGNSQPQHGGRRTLTT
jgi:hypothetical protein